MSLRNYTVMCTSPVSCSATSIISFFFFFNDTATTEIYTLSLHDALPICFETRALGQLDCVFRGNRDVLRGRAKSASALCFAEPDTLAASCLRHARADPVDDARGGLMRDHARERHLPVAVPAAAQYGVRRIHAGK